MNEVYKKCHEEMLADVDVDIINGGKDINLDKKDVNEKKTCCWFGFMYYLNIIIF